MKKGKFITIQNDLYLSEDITNEELVIYALILKNYNRAKGESIISFNMLKQFMQVGNRKQRVMDTIKESVKGLIKKGLLGKITNLKEENIDIKDLKNDDLFYIEVTDFTDNYFCVQEDQLFKLFKYLSTSKVQKFSLARYYIAICRVVNNDSCFGYLTQNSVKKIVVNKDVTITQYNKILKDLGLIIYNNDFITKERHYCKTFFSFPEYETNFNKQLQQEVQRQGLVKTDKTSSNIKRSETQKKNYANRKSNPNNSDGIATKKQVEEDKELIKLAKECLNDNKTTEMNMSEIIDFNTRIAEKKQAALEKAYLKANAIF